MGSPAGQNENQKRSMYHEPRLTERRLPGSLVDRLVSAEEAAELLKDGMTLAMSGYAMAGYPKAVVQALVDRRRQGAALTFQLITGANVPWLDDRLGAEQMISRRVPMCASRSLAAQANKGTLHYVEQQMHRMPRLIREGSLGRIDVAIIEALGITDQGEIIPTTSVGMTPHLIQAAEHLIIEINHGQPLSLMGLHDIHIPEPAPHTQPIPLVRADQRIGAGSIPIDLHKVVGIVETNQPERLETATGTTPQAAAIVARLMGFLEQEVDRIWTGTLPPVQTGFGTIADTIAGAFARSRFTDLQFFCGGVTEPVVELLASGKAASVSTGGIGMSDRVAELLTTIPRLAERLIIRNGDITNNAETIGRLGLIALNTGIEVDIYGNVNASHIAGSRVVNGIGGGANFAQNAGLSVILIPATAKSGAISQIVPMVSHHDIGEHDVDIIITEHGIADLRGLDDSERADAIIASCAAPEYREALGSYLQDARSECGGHHPQLPERAFGWYRRLKETGTMLQEPSLREPSVKPSEEGIV